MLKNYKVVLLLFFFNDYSFEVRVKQKEIGDFKKKKRGGDSRYKYKSLIFYIGIYYMKYQFVGFFFSYLVPIKKSFYVCTANMTSIAICIHTHVKFRLFRLHFYQ